MPFKKLTKEQYRALDADALETRKAEVIGMLDDAECAVPVDELKAEAAAIAAEYDVRKAQTQLRNARMSKVASGAGAVAADNKAADVREVEPSEDVFASREYNRAFARSITEGVALPEEITRSAEYQKRVNQFTTTVGNSNVDGVVVPTNLVDKIVMEEKEVGGIYNEVTKTSFPGGIVIPTMSARPTASWITEKKTSDDQKVEPDGKVTFSHFGLEVKVAQSYLTQAITLDAFQNQFVTLSAEARLEALDEAIMRGNGTTQPTGIINSCFAGTRGASAYSMAAGDESTWAGWHKFKAGIKRAYRRGTLIMADATWDSLIDGMVDKDGQPVARVATGINGEEVKRFMGIPVITTDCIADFDTATQTADAEGTFAIYTRLSDYAINSSLPLRAARWNDEDANVTKFKLLEFLDGKLLDGHGTVAIHRATV